MIRQKVIDNYRDMVASLKTELKLAEAEVERLRGAMAESGVGEELEEGQE